MPSALSKGKGKGQSEHAARACTMEPASKRARMTDAQAQRTQPQCSDQQKWVHPAYAGRGQQRILTRQWR
jgi:hypothetical protein